MHTFRCIWCGAPMLARLGKSRTHHFCHESGSDCGNGESDLHKYAKKTLRKRFLDSDSFEVGIQQKVLCGNKGCVFRKDEEDYECAKEKVVVYDLKKFGYDNCEEEVTIDGFIADLLLTSNSFHRPPILLEVAVTHPLEEEKKNSGLRIIEIPIKSEQDVEYYVNNPILAPDPDEYHARVLSKSPKFYGFAQKTQSKEFFAGRAICYVELWKNGDISCSRPEDFIPCNEIDSLRANKDCFVVLIDKPEGYLYYRDAQVYALFLAVKNGFEFSDRRMITDSWMREMERKMRKDGIVYEIVPTAP